MWDRRRPELNVNSVSLFTTAKTGMKKVQKDLRTFSKHHQVGIKAVPSTRIFFLISINRGLGQKWVKTADLKHCSWPKFMDHIQTSAPPVHHTLYWRPKFDLLQTCPTVEHFSSCFKRHSWLTRWLAAKNHWGTNESIQNFHKMTSRQCEFYPGVKFPWLCGFFLDEATGNVATFKVPPPSLVV